MTKQILIIFPTLHEVRSDYALIRVCGRTITVMLLHLQTALVSAFSLTTLKEHRQSNPLLSKSIDSQTQTTLKEHRQSNPGKVALSEVYWDVCHLQSDFAYQQGPQWPPGHWTRTLQLVPILCIHNLQAIICKQKGMSAFEGCQYGRCPGIWIGHVLPWRPNVREVSEICWALLW